MTFAEFFFKFLLMNMSSSYTIGMALVHTQCSLGYHSYLFTKNYAVKCTSTTNKVVGRSQSPLSLARVVHFRPCFASKCFPAQPLLMQMVSRGSVSTTTSLGDKWCTLKPTLFHKSFVQKNKKVLVQKWCYVFLTTGCVMSDLKNHVFHKAILNS